MLYRYRHSEDNGSPYKNEQLSLICASLGIRLVHSRVRQPQGKGKIERFFRTVQEGWAYFEDFNNFESLQLLNEAFFAWLAQDYTNRKHSSLDCTPRERFLQDHDRLKRLPPELIEQSFLHRVQRKVAADSTIRLNNHIFEVPYRFIGQKINIRFLPTDMSVAYIFSEQGQCQEQIQLLNKIDNSRVKRKSIIDYTKTGG